ncbi:MAG: helix-turn-helix transcriptional regulator, partial [Acidimicrobiaceae bacterium]|nr:helix-turn-helix transcriptional regulator [Acidimicrobiaceae bacterium]
MTTSESDAIFSALADPTRRAILSLIGEHEELP